MIRLTTPSFIFILCIFFSCQKPKPPVKPERTEFISVLENQLIDAWYPRVLDGNNGGYYTDFTYDWKKGQPQNKFIVTQARFVWSAAFLYDRYQPKEEYLDYSEHGFQFLKEKMWDSEYGGFYDMTDSTGSLSGDPLDYFKKAYGNSFAIYALAQYYKVSQKEEVIDLAKKAFMWLDKYARDSVYGGYFQLLNRNGSPVNRSENIKFNEFENMQVEVKDFNSSIHLLEAFTTLYQVWPDSLVRARLEEMYDIVSGVMMDQRGFLKLYFHPDWTPLTDEELVKYATFNFHPENHVTFGHDVETAFLLFEATEALEKDTSEILPLMKKMVDHSVKNGWDEKYGGLFDEGKYVEGQVDIINTHKQWWAQTEALNTFLLMDKLVPNDTTYYNLFEKQWSYIHNYLIDFDHGGFYSNGLDVNRSFRKAPKASIWKGNYHTIRTMVQCVEMMGER